MFFDLVKNEKIFSRIILTTSSHLGSDIKCDMIIL